MSLTTGVICNFRSEYTANSEVVPKTKGKKRIMIPEQPVCWLWLLLAANVDLEFKHRQVISNCPAAK